MRRIFNRWLSFAAALVFFWAAYRAVALAIVPLEAISYNHYASRPIMEILTAPFHPANQMLHAMLCHLMVRWFRLTEWAFRLPSLLGMICYFWASVRLCRAVCRSENKAFACALVFIVNPFTVGWLPVVGGVWAAAAFFLLALKTLTGHTVSLARASLLLGLACGFHISFCLPSIALLLLFLHFDFWGLRTISFWDAIDKAALPFALVIFALWCIPLLNRREPFRIEWLCVVLLPGLLVLAMPRLTQQRQFSLVAAGLALALAISFIPGKLPDLFHQGPEAGMPKVARALRDQIRRGQVHAIEITTPYNLIEVMNFYRRRYALGAVQPVRQETKPTAAEYFILPAQTRPPLPATKLFENRGIVLWMHKEG